MLFEQNLSHQILTDDCGLLHMKLLVLVLTCWEHFKILGYIYMHRWRGREKERDRGTSIYNLFEIKEFQKIIALGTTSLKTKLKHFLFHSTRLNFYLKIFLRQTWIFTYLYKRSRQNKKEILKKKHKIKLKCLPKKKTEETKK